MTTLKQLAAICCLSGLSLVLAGCPGDNPEPERPDATVQVKPDAAACVPTSCDGKQGGDDGCGTECGHCGPGTECNTATW